VTAFSRKLFHDVQKHLPHLVGETEKNARPLLGLEILNDFSEKASGNFLKERGKKIRAFFRHGAFNEGGQKL